jgi:NitT/TauT family transport system ATP-binding protein
MVARIFDISNQASAPCQEIRNVSECVELRHIQHVFVRDKKSLKVIEDINLVLGTGEFVSVVGPSGCGKSTLLRMISGLMKPTAGDVLVRGKPVEKVRTDVGYMFQTDALLPWRTVLDNVALPLRYRGVERRQREQMAREWIATVGLTGFDDAYPHQLSGGMRKRVSLASMLVASPDIILMDEPFSALDVQTRSMMENELMAIWQRERKTVLFVTHDLEEAIALSDKVVVLSARPARVKAVCTIDLPRPRNILDIRSDKQFHTYYAQLWGEMRDEVVSGYNQEKIAAGMQPGQGL